MVRYEVDPSLLVHVDEHGAIADYFTNRTRTVLGYLEQLLSCCNEQCASTTGARKDALGGHGARRD